jgi:aquaporin TIP
VCNTPRVCERVKDGSAAAMSGGVEMIAGAVIQRVASMLGGIAWQRIELLWNFKEDVQEMESKMGSLQLALGYADKRSQGIEEAWVQHWLKKYKSVAYDIEDALDELEADTMIWTNSTCTVRIIMLDPEIMYHLRTLFSDWREASYSSTLEILLGKTIVTRKYPYSINKCVQHFTVYTDHGPQNI